MASISDTHHCYPVLTLFSVMKHGFAWKAVPQTV